MYLPPREIYYENRAASNEAAKAEEKNGTCFGGRTVDLEM